MEFVRRVAYIFGASPKALLAENLGSPSEEFLTNHHAQLCWRVARLRNGLIFGPQQNRSVFVRCKDFVDEQTLPLLFDACATYKIKSPGITKLGEIRDDFLLFTACSYILSREITEHLEEHLVVGKYKVNELVTLNCYNRMASKQQFIYMKSSWKHGNYPASIYWIYPKRYARLDVDWHKKILKSDRDLIRFFIAGLTPDILKEKQEQFDEILDELQDSDEASEDIVVVPSEPMPLEVLTPTEDTVDRSQEAAAISRAKSERKASKAAKRAERLAKKAQKQEEARKRNETQAIEAAEKRKAAELKKQNDEEDKRLEELRKLQQAKDDELTKLRRELAESKAKEQAFLMELEREKTKSVERDARLALRRNGGSLEFGGEKPQTIMSQLLNEGEFPRDNSTTENPVPAEPVAEPESCTQPAHILKTPAPSETLTQQEPAKAQVTVEPSKALGLFSRMKSWFKHSSKVEPVEVAEQELDVETLEATKTPPSQPHGVPPFDNDLMALGNTPQTVMLRQHLMNAHNCAVLVDAGNVPLPVLYIVVQWLRSFNTVHKIVIIGDTGLYMDFEQLFPRKVKCEVARHARTGKNAGDILLAYRIAELKSSGCYENYIIISSDSDFLPISDQLGKSLMVFSEKGKTSERYVKMLNECDTTHFYINDLVTEPILAQLLGYKHSIDTTFVASVLANGGSVWDVKK